MAERAKEVEYAGEWAPAPLQLGQTLTGVCLVSAEDHLHAILNLFNAPPDATKFRAPVFAHATLAHAVLETSARAYWLTAPGLSFLDRASRAIGEHLYTRFERRAATGENEPYVVFKDRVAKECAKREMESDASDPRRGVIVGTQKRPGNQAAVKALFANRPDDFSKLVYGYYSAIAHGVAWGLLESLDLEAAPGTQSGRRCR